MDTTSIPTPLLLKKTFSANPSYIVPAKTGLPVETARSIISAARVTPPDRLSES
ncbi:MAG: hypothetical protein F6K24_41375 [Okeania sp. SIO2D1]|nr:hypothetical protein [Okeania sp. SIO2D1]